MHLRTGKFPEADNPDPRYRCGTLVYTKAGLFTLFSWLLWGDFCFSLMETVWPSVLPLVLKSQGAPNTILSIVMTTIPSVMNFVMNPIISTASDRHRGRRGRRIPFLVWSTPFITLFLILLGFSRELGAALYGVLAGFFPDLEQATVSIGLICFLVVAFRFFELFVGTVFWYLFNDLVPAAFMGRFLGLFRVVGSLAGAFFNFFIFRYAESHAAWIFFGAAVLYGTAFLLLCLNVKEGEYPPPDSMSREGRNPLNYIKTFCGECFSHPIFRQVFLVSFFTGLMNSIAVFSIFLAFSVGLNLSQVGKIAGISTLVSTLLMYPVGILVDRFHPLRVMLVAQIGFCLTVPIKMIFLFREFSTDVTFWIYACSAGLYLPFNVANAAANVPMLMRLFPHGRYGQFCSANAMCMALGTIIGGILAGLFLDGLKTATGGGDYYYRFIPLWNTVFMLFVLSATFFLFREWKKLGGDAGYQPPLA